MHNYQLFFTDYFGDEIAAEHAKPASKAEILDIMQRILTESDNFLGIVDQTDTTLQFMVNQDLSIYVDIPVMAKKGSYSKNVALIEALDIVEQLQALINMEQITDLEFSPW